MEDYAIFSAHRQWVANAKCVFIGGVLMLSIREDGYLLSDSRRFKCHASRVLLTKDDLKSELPDNFDTLTEMGKHQAIDSRLYKDGDGYIYSKVESVNLTVCEKCGKVYHKRFGIHTEEFGDVCGTCKNDFIKCEHCGRWYLRNGANIRRWLVCVDGDRVRQYLCEDCVHYDDDGLGAYVACPDCGDLILRGEEDTNGCCSRCHERHINQALFSYHYTDRPGYGMEFLGISERKQHPLFGIELEIDEGGESNSNAREIKKAIGENRVVCTTDGSLRDGFEIVSCPANLHHHLNTLKWAEGMKKAKEMGYVSHDGGHCGLHIHIDRAFFENQMRDDVEAKFFIILRNNLSWIRTFSRRYNFGYCQINGFERNEDGSGDSLGAITYPPDKVWLKGKKQSGRHMALNFYPENTIEIRVFRGTLNYNTFVATLQFAEMWANFVKKTELNNIVRIGLSHFINAAERLGYTEFLNYLRERKITDDNETGY